MKKLLVVSDVHGNKSVLKNILLNNKDADIKIFCGDLMMKDESLLKNFDYKISGNSDYKQHDKKIFFKVESVNIFLTHGDLYGTLIHKISFDKLYQDAKKYNADLVLYGHDHIKSDKKINQIRFFNPGSTTFPRDGEVGSYGIIFIDKDKIIKAKHVLIR